MLHIMNRRKSMACMKFFVFLAISAGLMLMSRGFEGRQFGKFSHDLTDQVQSRNMNGEEKTSKVRLLIGIGSRPPRCERMCTSCGHCEAVQVPISPNSMRFRTYLHHSKGRNFDALHAYYDAISNYKPMRWKCKCGDFILNP